MYCSGCGVVVAQGLSYCNYCGAKLARDDAAAPRPLVKPELLVSAMVAVFIFGLGGLALLLLILKNAMDLPVFTALGVALFPFLVMLFLEGVFLRLLFRGTKAEDTSARTLGPARATNELDAAQARRLPEPAASVTEHTTRAFDPAYIERKR